MAAKLYVVEIETSIVAIASGLSGIINDTFQLVSSANVVLDWFFLNGTKTPPVTGLTEGRCSFPKPALGDYVVRVVGTSSYALGVGDDSPSNYWRLGETSGVLAKDSIGGNDGTISGGVSLGQPAGIADGNFAMSFNGTTGRIEAASGVAGSLTRVQGTSKVTADNAASISISVTTPTVGNALVVMISATGGSGAAFPTSGCVDNRGNTYIRAQADTSISKTQRTAIYYCPRIIATGSPFTITVTPNFNLWMTANVIEVSGVGTGLLVDKMVAGESSGATATPSSGATAATLTANNELLVGIMTTNLGKSSLTVETLTPSWTQEFEELSASHSVGEADTRILTSALGTAPVANWVMSGGDQWVAALVAFKAGPTAATIALGTDWTIEAWIKTNVTTRQPVFSNRQVGGLPTSALYFGTGGGGLLTISASGIGTLYSSANVVNGLWRYVVWSLSGGSTVALYVDGVWAGGAGATLPANTLSWAIGFDPESNEHWNGGLDEIAIYARALTPTEIAEHYSLRLNTIPVHASRTISIKPTPFVCLEMEFLGKNNGWTIVRDWHQSPGLSWHRGLPGSGLLDLIADVGTLSFTLDNSAKNSAGRLGYYSPDHANKRYGFYLNIGVRLRVGSYPRFTGSLSSIDPVPGKFGPRTVSCEVTDWIGIADRTKLSDLPVLVNKRGDEVFQVLIDSLPISARPVTVQLDISPDTYPYTLDRTRDEETVLRDELYRLCVSGLSRVYLLGNGTLVYEARGTRVIATVDLDTFSDSHGFAAAHDRETVINRVQTTIHPRIPGTTDVVMYALPQAIPLDSGNPLIILGPWTDPANPRSRVGAVSLAPLVAGTDYTANAAADGSGTDLTSSMVVTSGLSGNATEFTISLPVNGFVTKLQQRGKPLYDYSEAVLRWEDTASIAQFGVAPQQIDMPYTADPALALEVAQYAVYNSAFPITNISGFTRIVDLKNTTEVTRNVSRQISDRIAISDVVTGVARSFFIQSIDETITENRIDTHWLLVPADTTGYWLLEVTGFTELDFTTRLGFGQIIGHTDIPHQDTHSDVAHSDVIHTDTHTDDAHQDTLHGDGSVHGDIPHTNVAHSDGAHSDIAFVSWHQDQAHTDVPHEDWHADTPHEDVSHGDDHYDVPTSSFSDHVDCNPTYGFSHNDGSIHTYHNHLDCWSSPVGSVHTDQDHYDNGGNALFHTNYAAHGDTAHGDDHWDIHGDIAHGDHTQSVTHQDVPYLNNHGDIPHSDIPHTNIAHNDQPHSDNAGHSDSVHQDSPHGDVAHVDVLHADVPHEDFHDDFHGDIN